MKNVLVLAMALIGITFSVASFADGGPASIEDAIEGCGGSYSSISCDAFEDVYIVRVHCTNGSKRAASEPFSADQRAQCEALASSAH